MNNLTNVGDSYGFERRTSVCGRRLVDARSSSTINGWPIIDRVQIDEHFEVILVDRGPDSGMTHRYVISTHNYGSRSWNNGDYFNADTRADAWKRFANRVNLELGVMA